MTDSAFWKQRHADFLTYAIRFADLKAKWKPKHGRWQLWWGLTVEGQKIPPEVMSALSVTSRKAISGRPNSEEFTDTEPWITWLNWMRERKWRGFRVVDTYPVSKLVWEAGVKTGRPPADVRRELKLPEAAEQEGDYYLEVLELVNLFRESADFCEDLGLVCGLMVTATTERPEPQLPGAYAWHGTFLEWKECVADLAQKEKEATRPRGPDSWMLGPVRPLREFHAVVVLEELRKVWDRIPEFKVRGRAAIHSVLSDELQEQVPEKNIAIIADAIWACILLHGDGIRTGPHRTTNAEESVPQEETQGVVEVIPVGAEVPQLVATAPKKNRGRPSTILDERKAAAAAVRASGGSNRDAAAALYNVKYPDQQQVKNVPSILRNYKRRLSRGSGNSKPSQTQ